MNAVSPTSISTRSIPGAAGGGSAAEPFTLTPAADPTDGPVVGFDCKMPAETPAAVTAEDLVAALDRAARTAIAPGSEAQGDAPNADDRTNPRAAAPVADALMSMNPFAALLSAPPVAAPPVAAQVIVSAEPDAVDDSVKATRSQDLKSATGIVGPTDVAASKLADPATAALFAMAKDMVRNAETARTETAVEVSVTMLSDTASDADNTPTFSLPPATAAMHQLASASSAQPVMVSDTMINRHLDLARGDAWLDTLAQDIAASAGTGDRLRFALQPEHLGKLDVEVARHDTGVTVHMTTRNEEARAIIAAAQPRLIDELRANGTRVFAADVTTQMDAQTNSQSGNASRRPMASFIEAAIDLRAVAATHTTTISASGRYA